MLKKILERLPPEEQLLAAILKDPSDTKYNEGDHLCKQDIRSLNTFREYLKAVNVEVKKITEDHELPNPDKEKDNQRAAEIRVEGNRLYHDNDFGPALDKFYESICWATNGSIHLGMGYANCSAVYHRMGEYECALMCITLAKSYNYPLQFMDKLLARELKCQEKLRIESSRISQISSAFVSDVARNPTIPFLAEGISMKRLPVYGRSMVADREFKAGDVILDEKVLLRTIESGRRYSMCHYCFSANVVLKNPCPKCISAIYCSEKCREADLRVIHRFECGISKRLDRIDNGIRFTGPSRLGLRMFFYGLTLLGGDIDEMMRFCKTHGRTGPDPFVLDYSNYDPLEEFKVFHQTKVPRLGGCLTGHVISHAVKYCSTLVEFGPVEDLVAIPQEKEDFLLQFLLVYMRAVHFLATYRVTTEVTQVQLYSLAALCNHSCVPNTCAIYVDGRLKFVVLRPIQKGEQILTSYNMVYPSADPDLQIIDESDKPTCGCSGKDPLNFKCKCFDCDPEKKRARLAKHASPLPKELDETWHSFGPDLESQLTGMQAFMQRYGHLHAHPGFDKYITGYGDTLTQAFLSRADDERRIQARHELADDYV